MARSLTVNGLWVLTAERSFTLIPAVLSAFWAAGVGASGINPFLTLEAPYEITLMVTFLSAENSSAFSRVVTTIPAFPSAGWVWAPNVRIQSGLVFNLLRPSAVQGVMPSSASTRTVLVLEIFMSTGII